MKVYVTHYTPLLERKPFIIRELQSKGLYDFEFIESHDREHLTDAEKAKFGSQVKLSEISLFYKHMDALRRAVAQPDDFICVFEDDAVLKSNFQSVMDAIFKNLPPVWDILFTAECCDLHIHHNPHGLRIPVFSTQLPFLYETNASRGSCMYVVNKCAGQKIIDAFEQQPLITEAIDHWLNRIHKSGKLKYFWCEPTIVDQGSVTLFGSSIR